MSSKEERRVRIWVSPETKTRLDKKKVLIQTKRGVRAESYEDVLSRKLDGMEKTTELLTNIYSITEDGTSITYLEDKDEHFVGIRNLIDEYDKRYAKEVLE